MKNRKSVILILAITSILLVNTQCTGIPKYKNPKASIEGRINDLLSRMTVEEKAAQLDMLSANDILDAPDRLNDKMATHFLDSMCIGSIHDFYPKTAEIANEVQRRAIENSRLGIPILFIEEALHGYQGEGATVFPVAIGNSTTWDTTLVHSIGRAIATEARAHGVHFVLGPNLDLARELRWGRVEETFGEDPYLSSRYAVNLIKGLQGNNLKDNNAVVAEPKHFGIHGIPESGSNTASVYIGEREARSTHLYVFEKAIKEAKAKGVMAAYHERDGIPCISDPWLLKTLLRDEWGFDGFVLSDLGAIARQYKNHFTTATEEEAIITALQSGLDMQFYDFPHDKFQQTIVESVENGTLSTKDLDRAVTGVLRVKFLLGLFDNPYTDVTLINKVHHNEAHRALALEAARKSIVLLQNKENALPFNDNIRSIVVTGSLANATHPGGYSAPGARAVSVIEGLQNKLGNKIKINHVNADISERFANVPATALTPVSNSTMNGLDIEYFNNTEFNGDAAYKGISNNLHLYWHNLSPAPGVNADNFSTRLKGYITAPITGEYEFLLNADDYARIYLDGSPITKTVQLIAGKQVPIAIEHVETEESAFIDLKWRMTKVPTASIQASMLAATKTSDAIVIVIGETSEEVGEGRDRQNLYPHQADIDLVKAAASGGKPVITIMQTGRPLILTEIAQYSTTLLQAWFAGEAAGNAIAEILCGEHNPSGKLTITFPKMQGQLPVYYSRKPSSNRSYVDGNGIPLFPFGHGLSYSTFEYANLNITPENPKISDTVIISFDITNTGSRDGAEVAQLYINDKVSSVVTPIKELKGFAHIFLKAGETQRISLTLTPEHFSLINREMKRVVEPGEFDVMVGSSSEDIRLNEKIELN